VSQPESIACFCKWRTIKRNLDYYRRFWGMGEIIWGKLFNSLRNRIILSFWDVTSKLRRIATWREIGKFIQQNLFLHDLIFLHICRVRQSFRRLDYGWNLWGNRNLFRPCCRPWTSHTCISDCSGLGLSLFLPNLRYPGLTRLKSPAKTGFNTLYFVLYFYEIFLADCRHNISSRFPFNCILFSDLHE
jgi:hypothetical protein